MKGNRLGKSAVAYEFAESTAHFLVITAGTRIATPVCALVRNDMLKAGALLLDKTVFRQYSGSAPGKRSHPASFCMSLRGAKRRGNPLSLL